LEGEESQNPSPRPIVEEIASLAPLGERGNRKAVGEGVDN